MTTTDTLARPAPAIPLTFAATPGGRFPPVLTEGHSRVMAPAGGEPMWVVHRYPDLLSVKTSRAWRMANGCETPLTGAELPGGHPPGHMLGMDGTAHRRLRQAVGHLFTTEAADALRPQMRRTAARLLDRIALRGTGDLRADYAEPATAATVCAALQVPVADWAPVIRPAGEIAFGVVQPGNGLAGAQARQLGLLRAGYHRQTGRPRRRTGGADVPGHEPSRVHDRADCPGGRHRQQRRHGPDAGPGKSPAVAAGTPQVRRPGAPRGTHLGAGSAGGDRGGRVVPGHPAAGRRQGRADRPAPGPRGDPRAALAGCGGPPLTCGGVAGVRPRPAPLPG